jgi:hypothetical protein
LKRAWKWQLIAFIPLVQGRKLRDQFPGVFVLVERPEIMFGMLVEVFCLDLISDKRLSSGLREIAFIVQSRALMAAIIRSGL